MRRVLEHAVDELARVMRLAMFMFLLAPLLVTVAMSLDARSYLGPFPPHQLSLQWYREFFTNSFYLTGLRTSVIVSSITAIAATLVGVSAAILVDRAQFVGKALLINLFLAPLVIPAVVIGFALLIFLARLDIYNGFWRLLAGHLVISIPYTFRMTLVSLGGISKTYLEAAESLGATEGQVLLDVTLPLARAGIVAGMVFATAFSMDDASLSMFLSDARSYTLPVAVLGMLRANFDLTIAAAAVILLLITFSLIALLDWVVGLERLVGQGIYRS